MAIAYLPSTRAPGLFSASLACKRYTEKTKLEIREHYMLTQNYAATAKEFGVNESTVRAIVKTPTRNGKLNDKGNHS